ncbi:MAG TPA: cob(I)yrinic acid a,c-diamide adenosyltransferase [Lacipirellulaceae bacterium]|jgi:cob(I)alamin adenosyltransferase|nr:cob(I)yrinic acid a,c-diamide adenosyltransferase [Lacipirellulaceae bacterium]
MAKIYTRTGDSGETSLLGNARVLKNDLRIEVIGSVDETNAAIGVVRAELARGSVSPEGVDALLAEIQHELFELGAELASCEVNGKHSNIADSDITTLELEIDRYEAIVEPLRAFILPGGAMAAAQLHVARCVCRHAERRLVELMASNELRGELLRYLNRLSDLLFVLARVVNKANRLSDVEWHPTNR